MEKDILWWSYSAKKQQKRGVFVDVPEPEVMQAFNDRFGHSPDTCKLEGHAWFCGPIAELPPRQIVKGVDHEQGNERKTSCNQTRQTTIWDIS